MTLKEFLKKKKIKQVELAKKLGVKGSVLSLQVNGWQNLPEEHLKKMCKKLGLVFKDFNPSKVQEVKND